MENLTKIGYSNKKNLVPAFLTLKTCHERLGTNMVIRDRRQILLVILSEFKRIN